MSDQAARPGGCAPVSWWLHGPVTDQQPLNADEILDVVDENDQVVGQAPRGEAYARRMRTRCAFVLARDAEDRIFVHRRTPQKLVFPSHYDMFVGGVVGRRREL